MQTKQKVTLKDIANVVGISVNSVSKALKNKKSISKETIKRVKEVADELGYIPDIQAQALKSGKTNVIAVIYDNLSNPYYSLMLEQINNQLFEKNYETMVFVDHHSIGFLSSDIAKKVISYRVAGILSFLEPTKEAKKSIDESGLPFILIGRDGHNTHVNSINSNDYYGGELAANVLLNKGCNGFLYYTKHGQLDINQARLNGFRDCLLDNNINSNNIHIVSIQTDIPNSGPSLIETLNNYQNIDAIFCFSDLLAFEVLQMINENDSISKRNILVIGYDNLQSFLPYPIRISSIAPNYKDVVTTAITYLLENQNENEINIEMPVQFFEGTTTKK